MGLNEEAVHGLRTIDKNLLPDQIMLEFYMPKGISDKPVFKEYNQKQIELLPKTADELIPQNHLVRLVDDTIDKMDLEPLLKQYKYGGGVSR